MKAFSHHISHLNDLLYDIFQPGLYGFCARDHRSQFRADDCLQLPPSGPSVLIGLVVTPSFPGMRVTVKPFYLKIVHIIWSSERI